jgi:tripartite-type tricarboxylate transporter receptor subunit TctC
MCPVMLLPRRDFLYVGGGAAALALLAHTTSAQTYPARPVRVIVPFGSAGATDIAARLIAQWLSERLGQHFVIDNRPGAGSNLGTEAVIRSAPDGYTLLLVGPPAAINATLYEKLSFNFLRDIAPVAGIVRFANVMVVNPSVPATTVSELIAYAKANPGKINFASTGLGSTPHVNGELFKMMAGVDMVHVPYRSAAAALTDLLSGQMQLYLGTAAATVGYVKAGSLRALAVTTLARSQTLPDIPTVAESVPGFEASAAYGLGAPVNTPVEIVAILNKEVNAALADAGFQARLADLGGVPLPGSAADFRNLTAEETDKWAKVVKFAGVKVD